MNFLVLNSDPIVLLDMVGMIRDCWPTSVVEAASTLRDALAAVEQLPSVEGAFIGLPIPDVDASGLATLIEQKQGKIVLSHFGQPELANDIAARGWIPLALPFTNETVRQAMLNAGFVSR